MPRMPTFVNGSEGGGLPAVPAAPYGQLIAEETKRTRAASDGDARPTLGRPRQFSVVAVDESRTTTALPPPHLLPSSTGRGSSGAAFPAEAPPLAATTQVTSNGINGHAKTDVSLVPETIGGEGGSGGLPASAAASIACGQLSAAALAASTDHPTSVALSELVLPIPAVVGGSSSNASDGQSSSSGSPKPKGNSSRGSSAAATTADADAAAAAVADESTPSLADEQATISAGVQHRIHYRKLREKPGSTPDAEQLNGGAKMDRLTVPTAASYHHSLPAAGQWNYPTLLGAAAAPGPRNISTLSLTLLLRDQRRKNLAMLARLFASRQKEKDLLDGTQTSYQELMSESKRKRCRVTSMQVAVASLFCILVALVTTSVLLFGPNRNIYRSQPGFVFDKDTRLLTVHNSSGYPLLQIRTGIDLHGLPYNCSTPDDLRNRRRCWKWSPANATLRVNVVNLSSELTCVDVTWQTTSSDPVLHDCIALGGMQWYGGTSSRSLPWSLNSAAATTTGLATTSTPDEGRGPGGAVLYAPGSTLGALAARAWLSSSAALVAAGGYAPLFFRLRGSSGPGGPAFCLSSYYGSRRSLNYTACVGADVPTVHRRLIESQRAATAWTSDDGPAAAAVAIDELGTTPSSSPTAAITQDDSHEDAGSGTTHTGALSPDDEPSDGSAPAAAAAAMAAVPAAASRARWSSAIVRPDPVWIVRTDSGADLLRQVVAHEFATGVLLIRESALSDPGRVKEAISNLTSEALLLNVSGLSFGLTVSAFVGVRSELFLDGRNEKLWTRSARSSLPVLVRDGVVGDAPHGGGPSVLVDPASELARELLGQRLREIADVASSGGTNLSSSSSTIGMLYLRAAIAAADLDLEAYSSAAQERLLSYPLWYARFGFDLIHGSLALGKDSAASTTLLVDGATSGLAGYTLSESVRQGSLADIVTHMLAASVGGDPPSSVGPFAAVEASAAAAAATYGGGMDSRHRYIRWMQLAAFAPVMLFDSAPWEHGADVVAISKRVLEFRQAEIVPRLHRLYEAFGRTGEPVYKPLWWNDSVAAAAKTSKLAAQFFLDDLLVAPVVDQRPYRLIYFPTGFWLDRGQKLFIGPGTHNYTVDLDSIPCFVRKTTGIHEQGITDADVGSSRR